MARPKPYNSKDVTKHLRQMAAEAHDWSAEDGVITKGEALAKMLWERALGWAETMVDEEGKETVIKHEPAAWAIQLVYDRMEGKTPLAITEDETRLTAAERVRELAKARLNDLAGKAVSATPVKKPGPPSLKNRRADNGE